MEEEGRRKANELAAVAGRSSERMSPRVCQRSLGRSLTGGSRLYESWNFESDLPLDA